MQKRTIQILSGALFLGLLLWGGYSTLAYLGVSSHMAVLIGSDNAKVIMQGRDCSSSLATCGLIALVPTVTYTITRAAPFLWYVVIALLVGGIFLGWSAFRTGSWPVRVRLSPAKIVVIVLALLWLLFTVLSNGGTPNSPTRLIVEPSASVYPDASPSVIAELRRNFDDLQQRNCLTLVGSYENGAKAYSIGTFCVQSSFVTRVLPPFLFVLLLLFELLVLGRMLLRLVRFPAMAPLPEFVMSAGAGVCGWIVLLWILAVAHLIRMPVAWAFVLLIPALGYRHVLHWIRQFVRSKEMTVHWPTVVLGFLLLSYLVINFLTVVRPFPIGWDDLGSYLNRPRLMVSYGSFIFSMAPFQWEYLTSLGFLLFGYGSIFGATASMMVNWFAGLLAVFVIYVFVRTFMGERCGLLSALLYYTLPLVGHFSFADMKIDNGVFSMGALATFALFLMLFPPAEQEEQQTTFRQKLAWVALAGVFLGFGFAMKVTVIMVVMALGVILVGASLHWSAFIGAFFLVVSLFVRQGVLDMTRIAQRVGGFIVSSTTVFVVLFMLGLLGMGVALMLSHGRIKRALLACTVLVAAFLCSLLPWLWHNNLLIGNLLPVSLEIGAPNVFSPTFDLNGTSAPSSGRPYRLLPSELRVDRTQPACKITGGLEELDRYWGNSEGWGHYLTLPWRTVLNLDSVGYYVTTIPALLLFPLLFLLPYFWSQRGRWLRWLTAGTAFILLEWMFLANGIPWYGIGVFLGLVVGLEAFIARAPDAFSRSAAVVLIAISLIGAFGMRVWQFEVQRNMMEYAFGKISAAALQKRTIPNYDDIGKIAVERNQAMPDRPYLYRIGTFIPYFIPRNLEVIGISDHQLDFFNCLYAERDPELTLKRLQSLGFNSIVFDTNTSTIEKDSNGTLHQKVNAFLEFANTPSLGIRRLVNDEGGGIAFILLP